MPSTASLLDDGAACAAVAGVLKRSHFSSRSRSDEVEEELARWSVKPEHKQLIEG